jgi:hypothetical protein
MFNQESKFKHLDKAYLAYISYVKMEHYYNNPIVNGFCELLVESMISAKMFEKKINEKRKQLTNNPYSRSISMRYESTLTKVKEYNVKEYDKKRKRKYSNDETRMPLNSNEIKTFNTNFEYKSFLRLRNLILLSIFLKNNKNLAKFRFENFREHQDQSVCSETKDQAIKRLCSTLNCSRN